MKTQGTTQERIERPLHRLVSPPPDDLWEMEIAFRDGMITKRTLGGPKTYDAAMAAAEKMTKPHGHTVLWLRRANDKGQRRRAGGVNRPSGKRHCGNH